MAFWRHKNHAASEIELALLEPRVENESRAQDEHATGSVAEHEAAQAQNPDFFIVIRELREPLHRIQGWRSSAKMFFWGTLLVFLVNTAATIWSATRRQAGGLSIAHTGDCERISEWGTGLHVVINLFSAVLLSGSNFIMQCLSGPTRDDMDKAHAAGHWMDVGIPSFRNLRLITRPRVLTWFLLLFSSLPIHLFYNAAVLKSIQSTTTSYKVTVVGSDLAGYKTSTNGSYQLASGTVNVIPALVSAGYPRNVKQDDFHVMAPQECITEYTGSELRYGDLVVLTMNDTDPGTEATGAGQNIWWTASVESPTDSPSWMAPNAGITSSGWVLVHESRSVTVQACVAQNYRCHLLFSTHALGVVVLCNACKLVAIFLAMRFCKDMLLSSGDAVASFLDVPEVDAKHDCLVSIGEVAKPPMHSPRQPNMQLPRRLSAIGWKHLLGTVSLWTTLLGVIGMLLTLATRSTQSEGFEEDPIDTSLFMRMCSLGFGRVDPRARSTISFSSGINGSLQASLMTNTPQLLLSWSYLIWNRYMTAVFMGVEWNEFYRRRKPLRVTSPHKVSLGQQRSTHWLQLPLRYSIPMIALSAFLHWLASQALFPILANFSETTGSELYVGYSGLPMLVGIVLVVILVFLTTVYSIGFHRSPMPVAGTCSMAIAAACRCPEQDVNAAVLPVRWGDVSGKSDDVGHCCLTSFSVRELEPQRFYR